MVCVGCIAIGIVSGAFFELNGITAVTICILSTRSSTGSGAACLSSTGLLPNTDFFRLQPKGDHAICACRGAGPISPKDRPARVLVVLSFILRDLVEDERSRMSRGSLGIVQATMKITLLRPISAWTSSSSDSDDSLESWWN